MESISGVGCIKGEIHCLMTLMRLNTRWAVGSRRLVSNEDDVVIEEENSLALPFRALNVYLEGFFDLKHLSCVRYIQPFHQVIVSHVANGPLTSAALSSLTKFALYGFLSMDFPDSREGINLIAECISHCVFEETVRSSDEIILMKILELGTMSLRAHASTLFSVGAAWDVYNTAMVICNRKGASKLLRSEAESALQNLTVSIFGRAVCISNTCSSSKVSDVNIEARNTVWQSAANEYDISGPVGVTLLLVKIMGHLSSLMNLKTQPLPMVQLSLSLVNTALEAGGRHIASIPKLVDILCGDVCRHVLAASQADDMTVFALSLRVVFNLFVSIKDHMKVQLEVFLTSVHMRLIQSSTAASNSSQSVDARLMSMAKEELALESLLEFVQEPALLQDLYTNYDCDVRCTNLFDSIIQTLCNRVVAKGNVPLRNRCRSSSNSNIPLDSDSKSLWLKSWNELDGEEWVDSSKKRGLYVHYRPLTIVNKLALDGVLSILHTTARRCVNGESEELLGMDEGTAAGRVVADNHQTGDASAGGFVMKQASTAADVANAALLSSRFSHAFDATDDQGKAVDQWCDGDQDVFRIEEDQTSHDFDTINSVGRDDDSSTAAGSGRNSVMTDWAADTDEDNSHFLMMARAKTAEMLRRRKVKKQRLRIVAEKFNANPLKLEWLQFATSEVDLINFVTITHDGILPTHLVEIGSSTDESSIGRKFADAESIATFLKECPGLGKDQVGEYLARGPVDKYPFHADVLREYVSTFSFTGDKALFDQALRYFLGHFRLPGESQCIDRIMEAFAGKLFQDLGQGNPFASADAAFILSFGTIMLNTDLHNPQMPEAKKMKKEEFIRNNRGINDNADLPAAYLEELYDNIKAEQIRLDPDIGEATTSGLTNYADEMNWNTLLRKSAADQAPAAFTPFGAARRYAAATAASSLEIPPLLAATPPPKFTRSSSITSVISNASSFQVIDNVKPDGNMLLREETLLHMMKIHYEKDMFMVMAQPILSTLLVVCENSFLDGALMFRLIHGLCDYVSICSTMKLQAQLDGFFVELCHSITRIMCKKEQDRFRNLLSGRLMEEEEEDNTASSSKNVKEQFFYSLVGWDIGTLLKYGDGEYDVGVKLAVASANHPKHSIDDEVQSKSLLYAGGVMIRSEILVKVFYHIVQEYKQEIGVVGWQAYIRLQLWARSRGVALDALSEVTRIHIHPSAVARGQTAFVGHQYSRSPLVEPKISSHEILCHQLQWNGMVDNKDVAASGTGLWGAVSNVFGMASSVKPSIATGGSSSNAADEIAWKSHNNALLLCSYVDANRSQHPSFAEDEEHLQECLALLGQKKSSVNFYSLLKRSVDCSEVISLFKKYAVMGGKPIAIMKSAPPSNGPAPCCSVEHDKCMLEQLVLAYSTAVEGCLRKLLRKVNGTIGSSKGNSDVLAVTLRGCQLEIGYLLDLFLKVIIQWLHTISMFAKENRNELPEFLWNTVHECIQIVLKTHIDSFSTHFPFVVERCIIFVFALLSAVGGAAQTVTNGSPDHKEETVGLHEHEITRPKPLFDVPWTKSWELLTIIKNIPIIIIRNGLSEILGVAIFQYISELGPKADDLKLEEWKIIFGIFSAACSQNVDGQDLTNGRCYVWMSLETLLAHGFVNATNISLYRQLVVRFIYSVFAGDEKDIELSSAGGPQGAHVQQERTMHDNPYLIRAMVLLSKLTLMLLAHGCLDVLPTAPTAGSDNGGLPEEVVTTMTKDSVERHAVMFPMPIVVPSMENSGPNIGTASVQQLFLKGELCEEQEVQYSVYGVEGAGEDASKTTLASSSHVLRMPSIALSSEGVAETWWFETCSTIADVIHMLAVSGSNNDSGNGGKNCPEHVLYCMSVVLMAGRIAHIESGLWCNALQQLVNRLPLQAASTTFDGDTMRGDTSLQYSRTCCRCCTSLFETILDLFELLKQSSSFEDVLIQYVELLLGNLVYHNGRSANLKKLSISSSADDELANECVEMLGSLFKMLTLKPSIPSIAPLPNPDNPSPTTDDKVERISLLFRTWSVGCEICPKLPDILNTNGFKKTVSFIQNSSGMRRFDLVFQDDQDLQPRSLFKEEEEEVGEHVSLLPMDVASEVMPSVPMSVPIAPPEFEEQQGETLLLGVAEELDVPNESDLDDNSAEFEIAVPLVDMQSLTVNGSCPEEEEVAKEISVERGTRPLSMVTMEDAESISVHVSTSASTPITTALPHTVMTGRVPHTGGVTSSAENNSSVSGVSPPPPHAPAVGLSPHIGKREGNAKSKVLPVLIASKNSFIV